MFVCRTEFGAKSNDFSSINAMISEMGLVEIPMSYAIKPLMKRNATLETIDRTIDGTIDEGVLMNEEWSSPESDNLAHLGVSADEDNVYITAYVKDADVQVDAAKSVWNQDCISLNIDLRSSDISTYSSRSPFYLRMTPSTDQMPSQIYRPENIPSEWQYACKADENGYSLELAIPIEFIESYQTGPWESIRLNVFFDDMDEGRDEIPRVYFEPNWRDNDSWLGSGLYFHE
jgi:hypothetical protein